MQIKSTKIELVDIDSITPNPENNNRHSVEQIKRLEKGIKHNGFRVPLIISKRSGFLISGHGRLTAAENLGLKQVPVIFQDFENEAEEYQFLTFDNEIARWAELDMQSVHLKLEQLQLDDNFDIELLGIERLTLHDEVAEEGSTGEARSLVDKFVVPPFSTLDTRQGYWQDRRKQWLKLGIESEKGRSENVLGNSSKVKKGSKTGMANIAPNTSVFDPVLCEIVYSWFSKQGDTILDPFAGGSVRGVIASELGRQYIGHELRAEQVKANRDQASEICRGVSPVWHIGDSRLIDKSCSDVKANLVFSCPPYADLEVYSDDPNDISNKDYPTFLVLYREIIAKTVELLEEDSFACFVVGDVRDKKGNYLNFVSDTIKAFTDCGLSLYNEIILINQSGTGAMRGSKLINASRKVVKCHQNVLVFVKGDGKRATSKLGDIEVMELDEHA